MSKKITVAADGLTNTMVEAGNFDAVSTIFSTDVALTGVQKYFQLAAAALVGNVYANYRHSGSLINFG